MSLKSYLFLLSRVSLGSAILIVFPIWSSTIWLLMMAWYQVGQNCFELILSFAEISLDVEIQKCEEEFH